MDAKDDTTDHLRLSERIDKVQLAKLMIGNKSYQKALNLLEPLREAYDVNDAMRRPTTWPMPPPPSRSALTGVSCATVTSGRWAIVPPRRPGT